MKNLILYKPVIITLFSQYLSGAIDNVKLVVELVKIELQLRSNSTNKCILFRFYNGDPLVTSIWNIGSDLRNATNYKYIRECMELAISSNELQVYFN